MFRLTQQGPLRPWLLFAVARLDDAVVPKARPTSAAVSTDAAATRVATRRRTATQRDRSAPPAEFPTPSLKEAAATTAAADEGQPSVKGKAKGRTTRRAMTPEAPPSVSDDGLQHLDNASAAEAAASSSARDFRDGEESIEAIRAIEAVEKVSATKTLRRMRALQPDVPDVTEGESLNTPVDQDGKWTVVSLKAALRNRGLPVSGRKAELLARLERAVDSEGL